MIIPYLSFRGDCEEAIHSYISILGGEILYLSRYTAETGGEELNGKVMHVEAKVAGSVIAASDSRKPVENFNAVRLMIHCDSSAEAGKIIGALGAGGEVLQRLKPHPPPDDGGMGGLVRDRYGYVWIITSPNDRK
ncbi:MAG: VOC family protein [Clostridiales bacterium]|nr:VOC family protein [Clostridiales bacterium]